MSRLISPLQVLLLALLALLLLVLWQAPGPLAGWRYWQAPPPQAPNLADVQAALLQVNPAAVAEHPEVLQRPLFSATRRPPSPAAVAESAPPPPPEKNPLDEVRIQGLLSGPTLQGVMLAEGDQTRFVALGQKVGAWTLRQVAADHVVFGRGSKQHRLELSVANAQGISEPAATAIHAEPPQATPTARPARSARRGTWPRAAASPPDEDTADGMSADAESESDDELPPENDPEADDADAP